VVIKDFVASGISAEEVSGVNSKFCVEMSKMANIELICAQDLQSLMEHQRDLVALGACNDEKCMIDLGNQLEADWMIGGSVAPVGKVLVLDVRLIHVKSNKVKARFSRQVPLDQVEQLLDAVIAGAEELGRHF